MKKAAFTLVEMLVAIAIVSIFIALLVPSFSSSFEKRKLNSGVRQIMDMVDLARSSSVAENRTFRINFEVEKNSFYIASESDPINSPGNFAALRTEEGKTIELPQKTFIRNAEIRGDEKLSGAFYIAFYKDGSCDEALIQCANVKGSVITLYLQPVFSVCKVYQNDISMEQIKDVSIEPIKKNKSTRKTRKPRRTRNKTP